MHRQAIAVTFTLFLSSVAVASDKGSGQEADDHSLTVEEYEARGMPPLDRPWREEEYLKALALLRALPVESLPRISSPRSSPVLEKVMDAVNYESCIKEYIPRLTELQSCKAPPGCESAVRELQAIGGSCYTQLEALRSIGNDVYAGRAFEKDPTFLDDFMVMVGMLADLAVRAVDFNDRIVVALEKIHPGSPDAARIRAVQMAKMSSTIEGFAKLLTLPGGISSWARVRFAKAFSAAYPTLALRATLESRARAEAALRRVAEEDRDPEIRAIVGDSLRAAEKARN